MDPPDCREPRTRIALVVSKSKALALIEVCKFLVSSEKPVGKSIFARIAMTSNREHHVRSVIRSSRLQIVRLNRSRVEGRVDKSEPVIEPRVAQRIVRNHAASLVVHKGVLLAGA